MFKRAIRFNYYYKYRLQRGAASDDEIKKQINAHTKIVSHAVPIYAIPIYGQIYVRNNWAKFVLLKKKDAYHIWLDERDMVKAIGHAFDETRKIEGAATPPKEIEAGPNINELNQTLTGEKTQQINGNKELQVIEIKKKQLLPRDDVKSIASVVALDLLFFWFVPVAAMLYVTIEKNRGKLKTADLYAEESISYGRRYDD